MCVASGQVVVEGRGVCVCCGWGDEGAGGDPWIMMMLAAAALDCGGKQSRLRHGLTPG